MIHDLGYFEGFLLKQSMLKRHLYADCVSDAKLAWPLLAAFGLWFTVYGYGFQARVP